MDTTDLARVLRRCGVDPHFVRAFCSRYPSLNAVNRAMHARVVEYYAPLSPLVVHAWVAATVDGVAVMPGPDQALPELMRSCGVRYVHILDFCKRLTSLSPGDRLVHRQVVCGNALSGHRDFVVAWVEVALGLPPGAAAFRRVGPAEPRAPRVVSPPSPFPRVVSAPPPPPPPRWRAVRA